VCVRVCVYVNVCVYVCVAPWHHPLFYRLQTASHPPHPPTQHCKSARQHTRVHTHTHTLSWRDQQVVLCLSVSWSPERHTPTEQLREDVPPCWDIVCIQFEKLVLNCRYISERRAASTVHWDEGSLTFSEAAGRTSSPMTTRALSSHRDTWSGRTQSLLWRGWTPWGGHSVRTNDQWPMTNDQWSMTNDQWSMTNDQ